MAFSLLSLVPRFAACKPVELECLKGTVSLKLCLCVFGYFLKKRPDMDIRLHLFGCENKPLCFLLSPASTTWQFSPSTWGYFRHFDPVLVNNCFNESVCVDILHRTPTKPKTNVRDPEAEFKRREKRFLNFIFLVWLVSLHLDCVWRTTTQLHVRFNVFSPRSNAAGTTTRNRLNLGNLRFVVSHLGLPSEGRSMSLLHSSQEKQRIKHSINQTSTLSSTEFTWERTKKVQKEWRICRGVLGLAIYILLLVSVNIFHVLSSRTLSSWERGWKTRKTSRSSSPQSLRNLSSRHEQNASLLRGQAASSSLSWEYSQMTPFANQL